MVLSAEGKTSRLPVLRAFAVLLFNKREGLPALVLGANTNRGVPRPAQGGC